MSLFVVDFEFSDTLIGGVVFDKLLHMSGEGGWSEASPCDFLPCAEIHDNMSATFCFAGTKVDCIDGAFHSVVHLHAIKVSLTAFSKHKFEMFIAIKSWFVQKNIGAKSGQNSMFGWKHI